MAVKKFMRATSPSPCGCWADDDDDPPCAVAAARAEETWNARAFEDGQLQERLTIKLEIF
jgi:hypothetical protein